MKSTKEDLLVDYKPPETEATTQPTPQKPVQVQDSKWQELELLNLYFTSTVGYIIVRECTFKRRNMCVKRPKINYFYSEGEHEN